MNETKTIEEMNAAVVEAEGAAELAQESLLRKCAALALSARGLEEHDRMHVRTRDSNEARRWEKMRDGIKISIRMTRRAITRASLAWYEARRAARDATDARDEAANEAASLVASAAEADPKQSAP